MCILYKGDIRDAHVYQTKNNFFTMIIDRAFMYDTKGKVGVNLAIVEIILM